MSEFSDTLKSFSKILFPVRCEICGEIIELTEKRCEECKRIEKIPQPLCEHCGCNKDVCTCKKHKNEYKQIVAPFYYKNSVVQAIYNFKAKEMPFLSKSFANEMYATFIDNYRDISFDYLTFVPMTKRDVRRRGYNQSYLLAKELSALTNIELKDLLIKTEQTKEQKSMTAKQRAVNLFGAFDLIDKNVVKDKTILLVDDVKTTGSTLNECAKMLKIYGASSVYAITFSIVCNESSNQ